MDRGASALRRWSSCSSSPRDRGRNSSFTPPTLRASPTFRGAEPSTGSSFTSVPALEPRSWMRHWPPSSRTRAACCRDTVGRSSRRSARGARPKMFSQCRMGKEPPPGRASWPQTSPAVGMRSSPRMARTRMSRASRGKRNRVTPVYSQTRSPWAWTHWGTWVRRMSAWGKARNRASPRAWSFSDKERTSSLSGQGMIEQDITKHQRVQGGEKTGRAKALPGVRSDEREVRSFAPSGPGAGRRAESTGP